MTILCEEDLVDAVLATDPRFLEVAGPGFRDTTRIAASNPQVWREIFLDNRAALVELLETFRRVLGHLERLVEAGDADALDRELLRIKLGREQLR